MYVKNIYYIVIIFFLIGCNQQPYSIDEVSSAFQNEENKADEVICYKVKVKDKKGENFDLNIKDSGDYLIDIQEPKDGTLQIVVKNKTKEIVGKINDNQIIRLEKGSYNLVATIEEDKQSEPEEIVFKIENVND